MTALSYRLLIRKVVSFNRPSVCVCLWPHYQEAVAAEPSVQTIAESEPIPSELAGESDSEYDVPDDQSDGQNGPIVIEMEGESAEETEECVLLKALR